MDANSKYKLSLNLILFYTQERLAVGIQGEKLTLSTSNKK